MNQHEKSEIEIVKEDIKFLKDGQAAVNLDVKELRCGQEKILTNHLPHIKMAVEANTQGILLNRKIMGWGLAMLGIFIAIMTCVLKL